MTWLDRLQRGSFKGFDFLTENHAAKGGRRLVVHELPGADEPVVEDLGGKAAEWQVTAYFIGPDYDLERNKFLSLLQAGGADWLNHPWLGRVWVRAQAWATSETNERGGYASVSVDFVAGGQAPWVPRVDMVDSAVARVRKASAAAAVVFVVPPMPASALQAFVGSVRGGLEVLRKVIALSALPLAWAGQIVSLVNGVKGDVATLMAVPGAYAAALQSVCNAFGSASGDVSDRDRPRVVSRLATAAVRSVPAGGNANEVQEGQLRARLLVLAAAEMALADYTTAADRDASLAAVVTALDALLPAMPDAVFEQMWEVRTGVIEALTAQDLEPAQTRDVVAPMPSVLLAHRLEVDEEVFLAQNGVTHPLFVVGRVYG